MSVSKLCEAINHNHATGISLEVFTTTANGENELNVKVNQSKQVDGVKVTYFKRLTKDHTHFSPALLWALRKEILRNAKNKKPLVIHIHAWWNMVSVLSCAIAMWYKVPVVLSPRGMLTSYTATNRNSFYKKIIHRFLGRTLLNYCRIHATSELEHQDILSFVKPKNITVIPNLVSLNKLNFKDTMVSSETTNPASVIKFIYLSRIEEKKGIPLLFEALAKLNFNWCLSIAGTGDEVYINSLKQIAKNLQLNTKIIWLGLVKNDVKFELLHQHDLMLLTSYNENFANVVIESLSVGTPVLMSENVGLKAYIKKNDLGWITKLNAESIASGIQSAYLDGFKRNKIKTLAPQLIHNDFNDKVLAKKYIELYNDLLNGKL